MIIIAKILLNYTKMVKDAGNTQQRSSTSQDQRKAYQDDRRRQAKVAKATRVRKRYADLATLQVSALTAHLSTLTPLSLKGANKELLAQNVALRRQNREYAKRSRRTTGVVNALSSTYRLFGKFVGYNFPDLLRCLGKDGYDSQYYHVDADVRKWTQDGMSRKVAKLLGEPKLEELFINHDKYNVPDSVAELSDDEPKPKQKK